MTTLSTIASHVNTESDSQQPEAHNPRSRPVSQSTSLSSELSLPSLPSLDFHPHQASATHQLIATLKGHSSYVSALAVHGKTLYSGSSDQEIRLWSSAPAESGTSGHAVAVCPSAVKSLVIAGDKLFGAHQDQKIRVWNIDHGYKRGYKLHAVLPTFGDRFLRLLWAKNYIEVRRHKKCTWVHHVDAVSALAVSQDQSLLYSVSWDRTLKIWRTTDYKCMESVAAAHHDAINAVAVSCDGLVYTGSADKTIKVWRRLPGEQRHSMVAMLEKHKSAVNALALSADGRVLYSGACDRSVVVWEGGRDGCMVATGALRGHTKPILCLATVSDLVCSGSADRTVRVWRRGEEKRYSCLAMLEGHRGPIKSLAVAENSSSTSSISSSTNPFGRRLFHVYSGSMDCDIKLWKLLIPSM